MLHFHYQGEEMGDYRRYDDENIQMGSKYVIFDFLQTLV